MSMVCFLAFIRVVWVGLDGIVFIFCLFPACRRRFEARPCGMGGVAVQSTAKRGLSDAIRARQRVELHKADGKGDGKGIGFIGESVS